MTSPASEANSYLLVPIVLTAVLLGTAVIRGPNLVSASGIGSAIIVAAPLILATYSLMVLAVAGCRNGICGLVICWRYLCLGLVRAATLSDLLWPTKTYCVSFVATALSFTFTFVLRCKITSFSIVVFKVCYYSCFPFVFISIIACEICLMIPKKFKPPN